jgi:hypothetical protein
MADCAILVPVAEYRLLGGLENEVYRFNPYLRQQLSRIDFASIWRCPVP